MAERFGWEGYKNVIKSYYGQAALSGDERNNEWVVRYSKEVNKNLCPYFEWWNWPLTDATKEVCSSLPSAGDDLVAPYLRKYTID